MKRYGVLALLAILLSGCATVYRVNFNGYLSSTAVRPGIPAGASFCVLENKNAQNPIFETQIKSKIEGLLKERGYSLVPYDQADFYLGFVYGISPGRIVTDIVSVYHPAETGTIQTYTSTGKIRTSYVNYPAYTAYVPEKKMVYTVSLTLDVLDADILRRTKEEEKIWIAEVTYTCEQPDIREGINYLLAAAFTHFGENTSRNLKVDVSRNNPQLEKLMR